MTSQADFLKKARVLFDQEDYDACLNLLAPYISQDAEAAEMAKEVRRKLEELRSRDDWEVYLENLKKEAMDLFDKEQYFESQEKFAFLSRQNPEDRTVQDYVQLCLRLLSEMQERATAPSSAGEEPLLAVASPSLRTMDPEEAAKSAELEESVESAGEIVTADPHIEDQEKTDNSAPQEIAFPPHSRKTLRIMAAVVAVLTLIAILWFWKIWEMSPSSLDIVSEPEGADVWLNGELKGKTHLHLEPVEAGNYNLKVEMPGYLTYSQQLLIGKRQPTSLSVKLARIPLTSINPEEMLSTAAVLFNQGKLIEAQEYCDRILENQPKQPGALELKRKIFERLHPEQFGGENLNSLLPPPGTPPPGASPSGKPVSGTVTPRVLPPPASSQVNSAPAAGMPPQPSAPRQVPAPAPTLPSRGVVSNNQPAQSFNVIHHHFVGSCRGDLTLKEGEISFSPAGSSDDGFIRPYSEIEKIETGKSLKIQFKNKTFRFELADISNEMDNRQKLVQISRRIMEKMAETRR
jgi:tetratricopeptide (TPR) repeat protein